jgi:hypothetical protein
LLANTFKGSTRKFDDSFKTQVEIEVNEFFSSSDASNAPRVTINEIKTAIKKLNPSSAAGPSKVHNAMLKNLPDCFLTYAARLADLSFDSGTIPEAWKLARITLIPKGSSGASDPNNYRPISVTCALGKLIERVLQVRIYDFLENRNFFNIAQSGFRAHRRTTDNLLFLTQKIKENMCRRKKVCGLFFDIRKAFDSVWHCGILYKLIKAGLPKYSIVWVAGFLSGRTFVVNVCGCLSDCYSILAGVPQGAVLSPLLFIVFINDLPLENRKNLSFSLLFADDLCTSFIYKRHRNLASRVNKYLKLLAIWLDKYRLEMNVTKCNYTIFCKGTTETNFNFKLYGQRVPHCANPKFLGIIFDSHLSFESHVKSIKAKCMSRLNIIKILSHRSWKLSKNTLVNIYRSLIGSLFDYIHFAH